MFKTESYNSFFWFKPVNFETIFCNLNDVRMCMRSLASRCINVWPASYYSDETNVFEACANGASVAGKTAAIVLINYIAFMGILAWFNATLSWLGGRVGNPELSFEVSEATQS